MFDDQSGDFGQIAQGWSLDITAPPPNDNFSNAQAINTSTATLSGNNVSATSEDGELQSGSTVWYRWTAPGTGQTTIDMCSSASSVWALPYTGDAVNALTRAIPDPGPSYISQCTSTSPSPSSYRTTFPAQVGTTYNIQVNSLGAKGNFTLNLSGPANTPPTITPLSPLRPTRDTTPLIRATVTDTATNLAAADNIKLYVDGRARPFSYDAATKQLSYTSSRLTYAWHTARIDATDAHGGTATKSWRFKVFR